MDTFKNRLCEALAINKMRAVDLSNKTGISKGRISQYMSGLYEPKPKALYEIAKALNVNESWLIGLDVSMESPASKDFSEWEEEHNSNGKLADEVNVIELLENLYGKTASEDVSMYLQLDDVDRGEIRGEMKHMLKADKYSLQEGLKDA